MNLDLVCGTAITEQHTISATYRGHRFGFCSIQCKQKFQNDPEAYLAEAQRHGIKDLPTRSMIDGPAPIWSSSGTPSV